MRKVTPFINKYNWKKPNYPSGKDDWKKFEKNNVKISPNFAYAKKEKMHHSYVSKHNFKPEKQVILLVISNGEKLWHYVAVKKNIGIAKRNNF